MRGEEEVEELVCVVEALSCATNRIHSTLKRAKKDKPSVPSLRLNAKYVSCIGK